MQLVNRHPQLDADSLVQRFIPPHRFEDVSFSTYIPDSEYASQKQALETVENFATRLDRPKPALRFWKKRRESAQKQALYLDGGFGTGKTHLLASLWHAAPEPRAYMTFTELTSFIGFVGMQSAIESFSHHKLLCIDEFELDDVANTLMVVSFLRGTMSEGMHLAVTSNTLPDRLGEKRFSASEFRREIAAISSYFDELRVDGPDYRTSHSPVALHIPVVESEIGTRISTDSFDELIGHLKRVHPVQYGAMLDDLDAVVIKEMHPIIDQDDALLVVQFVDKLYDARIPVSVEGCEPSELFDESFRLGGYRKKYGRAESRLTAMKAESSGLL